MYVENDELGNFVLEFTKEDSKESSICETINKVPVDPNKVWKMYFDGASSKDG
jgi:hypothetical protein